MTSPGVDDFFEAEELEERIQAVTDHLRDGLRSASLLVGWTPTLVLSARALRGRPRPIAMPRFDELPHLGAWASTFWGVYSRKRRSREYERNERLMRAWNTHQAHWKNQIELRGKEIEQFDAAIEARKRAADEYNLRALQLRNAASEGDRESQWEYSKLLVAEYLKRNLPRDRLRASISFESKRAVLEVEVPNVSIVPREKSVRQLKTTGEIRYSNRTDADVRRLYSGFLAQVALSTVNAFFVLTGDELVETAVVNLYVVAPDPATGQVGETTLLSLMASRREIDEIDLSAVDPVTCLRHLSATVSRSPSEVVPVRPIASVDMSDARFVTEADVLSTLDTRPNLMELSPTEFESLVQNLFASMGLDTKQTRASRDGGVDAIAFDPRPIIGGKIVIQAKRYKNVVGVSAVRDLFGTLQNEGGSKGILVTTSGYGKASFEFAKNKPLELIDGSGLLFLLKEHAGIDARIVVPEDWRDPATD
ncbi:MAG: restriction endonuclease [Microcella sp.]|uniref:restriction endonuclease n=1 Tax=Microcella sp. TaxID=1913979 RepID=UPI0033163018